MNFFKKSRYLLAVLLASFCFVTFVPQISYAQNPGAESRFNQQNPEAAPQATENTNKVKTAADAVVGWLAEQLGHIVYFFTVRLPSLLLVLEIRIFRWVGPYNGFATQPQVIQAWKTVRDLANMFFILILLLMAFGTILQVQGYGYRQLLSRLLIMAILINFSKSIVALLIDFSQIVTLTFLAPVIDTLSGNLVVALGLTKIMTLAQGPDTATTGVSFLMAMILGGIMMIITTVIMGVILIMFVMRVITFWILIILAPIAFLAHTFPQTDRYYKDWENELSKNLTLGPALAFFIWLAFSIVGQGNISDSFGSSSDLDSGSSQEGAIRTDDDSLQGVFTEVSTTSNMLNFVIAISLLMAGLKFASQSGAAGASFAGKASGNLQKWGSRIGRGATIGVAGGAALLAWRGTSKEGGIKGGASRLGALAGRGAESLGESTGWGGLQRAGIKAQSRESQRREKKQERFEKRLSGMSEEEKRRYTGSFGRAELGWREARAASSKMDLEGRASIDPTQAKRMQADFERAGDNKSLERLRGRSMAVNTAESLEKTIADKGLDAVAKMNVQGMTAEQASVLLKQDTKALSGMIEKMDPSQKADFMKELDTHIRARKIGGTIGNEASELHKARILQGKYDGKNADLHADFASAGTADRETFSKSLQKASKGEDMVKIDPSSDLFKAVAEKANAGQVTEMLNKAEDNAQRENIINSQIRMGNIQTIINNPAVDRNMVKEDDIVKHFDEKITAAMGTGATRLSASSQVAQRNLNFAHLAFQDPSTHATNYANFASFAKTLRFDDLLKIETAELKKLISIGGLTPEQIQLLKDRQGIT